MTAPRPAAKWPHVIVAIFAHLAAIGWAFVAGSVAAIWLPTGGVTLVAGVAWVAVLMGFRA